MKRIFFLKISATIIFFGCTKKDVQHGTGYPEIFAKTNSGIYFNQKVSIGFVKGDDSTGAGEWDY